MGGGLPFTHIRRLDIPHQSTNSTFLFLTAAALGHLLAAFRRTDRLSCGTGHQAVSSLEPPPGALGPSHQHRPGILDFPLVEVRQRCDKYCRIVFLLLARHARHSARYRLHQPGFHPYVGTGSGICLSPSVSPSSPVDGHLPVDGHPVQGERTDLHHHLTLADVCLRQEE